MGRVSLEGTVTLEPASTVELRAASGHSVISDALPPLGADRGARPTELVLAALGACTAYDVISILRKKRQRPTAYALWLEADAADEPPAVFRRVVVEHRIEGEVGAEELRRSIELSATRYCPVSRMLSASVEIEHRYRLRAASGDEAAALVVVTGPTDLGGAAGAPAEER